MVSQGNSRLLSKMIIKTKKEAIKEIRRTNVRKRERGIKAKISKEGLRVKAKEKARMRVKETKRMRISIKIFLISWRQP